MTNPNADLFAPVGDYRTWLKDPPPRWTHDLPAESGYYWYKEEGMGRQVVYWDKHLRWIQKCGHEIPDEWWEATGQFYPEPLKAPE